MPPDLDFYYESLEGAYGKLQAWAERVRHPPLWARLIQAIWAPVGLFWIVSVIPFIPYVLANALAKTQPGIAIVFVASWTVSAVASTGLVGLQIAISQRTWTPLPPVSLSPDQLTFMEVHATHRLLHLYSASSHEDTVRQALSHARNVFDEAGAPLYVKLPGAGEQEPWRLRSEQRTGELTERYLLLRAYLTCGWRYRAARIEGALQSLSEMPWLDLAIADRDGLSALAQLGPRVVANLEARSNLEEVKEAVRLFADYTYQMLPEVASRFDEAGHYIYLRRLVDDIVQAVSRLPQGAKVEAAPIRHRERSLRVIWTRWPLVRALVYTLGCFALLLTPVAVIVEILRTFLRMSDDAYAGAVVAATAVFAVGLVNWLPVRRPGEAPALRQGGAPHSDTPPTQPD